MMNDYTMSKEQIEEMARVLDEAKIDALATIGSMNYGFGMWYAKALYNAGYRKHREGEWKKMYDKAPRYVCTSCSHLYNNKEYKHCPNCGAKMKGGAE